MQKQKFKDISGETFGKLTVVSIDPDHINYPQKFIALCECGVKSSYFKYGLTSGKVKNCQQCAYKKLQKATDTQLSESYDRLKNVWEVAKEFGMCGQSVHERLIKLGIQDKMNYFTDDEVFFLREHYMNYLLEGKLQELADKMGRTKSFICRQAKELGFTDLSRKKKLLANFKPSITKGHWDTRQHPKGMLGKKSSQETKDKISAASIRSQAAINSDPDRRVAITKKLIETKFANGTMVTNRQKVTWKGGWREIGGKRKYFRSRWEANYARYLQWLKDQNQIKDWEHEAKVFWFEGIKRGCVSYLPDFQITELNDNQVYHEVKGWMDDRSKTKIRRMGIYFPEVSLTVIGAEWFKKNNRNLTSIIYGWET
jgi:hypothetical protein